ncbi:collagen-binding domain-containing protein [Tautonia plasticadhaerens]|uniref:PEP-CTERM motif protein n=1 Tax=Tautonia plasticadhaerens TaxID=2527974 RepID=A0A518H6L5_9BACT|nr:collagen-binding domain-containing protein [Tautonia plasticadhaerens]QDV36509.1 PEP-CTERM motif protein [Tautonia plasticadhaerens]
MTRSRLALVTGLVLSAAGISPPSQARAGLLTSYNLVTTGDMEMNSHVNYNTFVGGNLTANGAVFSDHSFSGTTGLTVVGSISGSNIQVNGGKDLVVSSFGQGSDLVLMNGGDKVLGSGLPALASSIATQMADASAAFKSLSAGASNTVVLTNNGQLTFTVGEIDTLGRAVFSVDGSIFSNNAYQNGYSIAGSYADATSIILNVSGTTILHNHGQFNGEWNTQGVLAKTLWNFSDATSIDLHKNFSGAILAPRAHLTKGSTSTDGSIFVKSLLSKGETHSPYYSGFDPTSSIQAVPEPSTLVLAGIGALGFGGYALARRRRG